MWFKTLVLYSIIFTCYSSFGKSELTLRIQQKWQCAPLNEVSMKFGKFNEYCMNDFLCHKSGEYDVDISSTIMVGKGNDCPTSTEGYADKERDTEATKGIGAIVAPREADKPNSTVQGCKINPAFLNNTLIAHMVEYIGSNGKLKRFCALGAICGTNDDKRTGVVGCMPVPDKYEKQWVTRDNGEKELVDMPVCRSFNDCVANKFTATAGLLTSFDKEIRQKQLQALALDTTPPHSQNNLNSAPVDAHSVQATAH
jgi:hypothetical protein